MPRIGPMSALDVSFVIPCYNEEQAIDIVLTRS